MVSFTENPEAYCLWAKSHEDRDHGLELLAGCLADDSWKHAAGKWMHHFSWPPFWKPDSSKAGVIRRQLVELIVSGSLDDAAHEALPGIFNTHGLQQISEAGEITQWLVSEAGPNDATMVCDVVDAVIGFRDTELIKLCFPLVEWLYANGSSELRSPRRSRFISQLVPIIIEQQRPDLLTSAVRYVLYSGQKVRADGFGQQTIERLAVAIEKLLSDGASGATIGDLAEACEPEAFAGYVWRVFHNWQAFPKSRAEVVRRMARGQVDVNVSEGAWPLAIMGPPVDIEICDASIARSAAKGLESHGVRSLGHRGQTWTGDEGVEWGRMIARDFIRTTGVLETRSVDDIRQLQKLAGFDERVGQGAFIAVRDAVTRDADPVLAEARAMLQAPGTTPALIVDAALELLVSRPMSASSVRPKVDITHVVDAIRRAAQAGGKAVCGFDFKHAISKASEVRVEDLPGERAFLVDGDGLVLTRVGIEGACSVFADPEEQRALGVLYAIHEVVHDFQGIAEKSDVSRVRFAGAESALMHVDLGADHVAAVIANSIWPEWDLLWLKDLEGKSIQGFPASARHPRYSRIRKTLRLVGLRVDLALRKLSIGTKHLTEESYGFADFSPSGGTFVAMVNRPPFAVVKTSTISSADAAVLFEGIEGGEKAIERVDEVVERALSGS